MRTGCGAGSTTWGAHSYVPRLLLIRTGSGCSPLQSGFGGKQNRRLLHRRNDWHTERTAGLAGAAAAAGVCLVGKQGIVLPHRLWNCPLGLGKVGEFEDSSDVNSFWTGCAVAAIHAVSLPLHRWESAQSRCIIFFLFRCGFVGKAVR